MKAGLPFFAGLVLGLGVSCSTPAPPWSVDELTGPRPFATLDDDSKARLLEAIELYEDGELDPAREELVKLVLREPRDIYVAIWYQDVRLACAEANARRQDFGREELREELRKLRDELREECRREADDQRAAGAGPDSCALAYVLAARLEDDGPAAKLLLQQALELDPSMSWAHYGLAHVAARAGDLAEVTVQLERTFELEPDHLPALRLYGWTQAQSGELEKAAAAFEAWRARFEQDLLATERTHSEVALDLALVYLADEDAARASELIDSLPPGSVDEARRLTARAAVEQVQDQPDKALQTAVEASWLDPDALLPAVQQALLLELWLKDVEGARRAWRRVVEISAGRDDLAAGLQRFRAQLHLSRLRGGPEDVQ